MKQSRETTLRAMLSDARRCEQPPPPPQKSLQIKQEDSFFCKLLSRESSRVNSSSRVFYYGGAPRAVPFQWESQPGTPIRDFAEPAADAGSSFPPLTPPPSFYSKLKSRRFMQSKNVDDQSKPKKCSSKSNVFSKINHNTKKTRHVSQSSSGSSTSSTSTWSTTSFSSPSVTSASSTESKFNRRDTSCARASPVHFGLEYADDHDDDEDEEEDMFELPVSAMRLRERRTFLLKLRSFYPVAKMKSTFCFIMGNGSGQGSV
ncbi:hypothetical protein BT93_J0755 [Corymbia citriodora subsp. variegata]|nr:hypothetical protein BT93_J0755 [Corymbia citriodora subsp. variegata]